MVQLEGKGEKESRQAATADSADRRSQEDGPEPWAECAVCAEEIVPARRPTPVLRREVFDGVDEVQRRRHGVR